MELWPFEGNVTSAWTQGRWNEYLPSPKAVRINFARDGIDRKWSVSESVCCSQGRFWSMLRLMIRLVGFVNCRQTFLEPLVQDFYWLGAHCLRTWERKRQTISEGTEEWKGEGRDSMVKKNVDMLFLCLLSLFIVNFRSLFLTKILMDVTVY